MLVAWIPLLVAIVGFVLHFAKNGKVSNVGTILLLCGALVTTWSLSGRTVSLGDTHEARGR